MIFGEIYLQWGIVWNILTYSLDTTSVIIKREMHLHRFLVNYRDTHYDKKTEVNERIIFYRIYREQWFHGYDCW